MPWLTGNDPLACEQAAVVLDFPELLGEVAAYAHLPRSARSILDLTPLTDRDQIDARRLRVAEWTRLLDDGLFPDLTGLEDPGPWLEKSHTPGAEIGGVELRELAATLRALGAFGAFLAGQMEVAPTLHRDWGNPVDLGSLAGEIERCLDEEGEVLDGASPLLRRLRSQIREAREQVRSTLSSLIKGRLGGSEKDIRPRVRSGRLVLPVIREERSRLAGIIHDESATGRTLFVEPLETVELNNRVSTLQIEESREVSRILRDLSHRVGEWADEIRSRMDLFHGLDIPLAVARASRQGRYHWAEWPADGHLKLDNVRHPLLGKYLPDDRGLVPLSMEMPPELHLLLVTGPNTGGKTVLLKTLGLMVLMNQCGFPLPTGEGTTIPIFGALFVGIGDEQSIHDSQSTFSAHLGHLARMAEEAGEDTLILVDEIGDGTDPQEGAALAQALMDHWIGKSAHCVITTHFGVLKGFAQQRDGAANASMDFDPVARRPLYTLRFGVPGSSRAITTARRLGMTDSILDAAEKLMGEDALSLESLLERLERETGKAEKARLEGEEYRLRYEELAGDYKARMAQVRKEEKQILRDSRLQGESFLGWARGEIEGVVRELREQQAGRASIQAGREKLAAISDKLKEIAPTEKPVGAPLVNWRVGDRVRVMATGQTGEIIGEAGVNRLRISIGSLSLVIPLGELTPVGSDGGEKKRDLIDVGFESDSLHSYRLDLRGMTVEEALEELDMFLDGAVLASFELVEVLHGKGTGALRQAIGASLARDRRVRSAHLADQSQGGTGVTIAHLAGSSGRKRGGGP
jgi:DNA mismatch repair protein MutS2